MPIPGVCAAVTSVVAGVAADVEPIGAEQAFGSTITIPAGHAAGDLIVMVAWQDGSGTPAAPDGTWTLKADASRTGFAAKNFRTYSKVASGSSETSGTWSNVDGLHCHVYRNASGLGDAAIANDGASAPDIPALTLDVSDGSSWVMAWAGEFGSSGSLNPSVMTDRTSISSFGSFRCESWDTNAGVSSFAQKTNIGGSADWVSMSVEILKAA